MPRRRTCLLLSALIGLLLTAAFEPTYCVRGWLRGEAFFEGRPTSYWRSEIDQWIARHPTPQEAERCEWRIHVHFDPRTPDDADNCGGGAGRISVRAPAGNGAYGLEYRWYPRSTIWGRVHNWWQGFPPPDPRPDSEVPLVLSGLRDAEAVWTELESMAAYQPFVRRARTVAAYARARQCLRRANLRQ
jgi:hypothetical protein